MPSQGKAYTAEQKEFIVRLKHSYDEERATQSSVSTRNPAARVAKGLQVGLSTVKIVLAAYHRTGQVSAPRPTLRGKPSYRIGSALETRIRQRVREVNRGGGMSVFARCVAGYTRRVDRSIFLSRHFGGR